MQIISRAEAKEQGLKHYFTGKPCSRGHVEKRFVSSFQCVVCAKMHYDEARTKNPERYAEATRKHYQNNREKCIQSVMESQKKHRERHLKNKRDYHHRNKDRLNARSAEWYKDNKELAYQRQKEYREKNAEKVAEYQKEYRQANKDRLRESQRDWTQRNRGRINEANRRRLKTDPDYKSAQLVRRVLRKALERMKQGKLDKTEKLLGYTARDFKEHIERNMLPDMSWENHGELWHVDHVIPVVEFVRAGITDPAKVNALSNLMPEYAEENLSKGAGFALSPPPVL